jgi:hypothetical protein
MSGYSKEYYYEKDESRNVINYTDSLRDDFRYSDGIKYSR